MHITGVCDSMKIIFALLHECEKCDYIGDPRGNLECHIKAKQTIDIL